MRKSTSLRLVLATVAMLASGGAAVAEICRPEDVFAVIDSTGQRLREINSEWQPRLHAKYRELAQKNGWSEGDFETRGRAVIEDGETRVLDARAGELLADLDRLGDGERSGADVCDRLAQVRAKSAQIAEVSQQRAAYAIGRIDAALKKPAAVAQLPVAPPPVVAPPTSAVEPIPKQAAAPPPRPKAVAAPSPPPPPPPAPSSAGPPTASTTAWDSRTMRDAPANAPTFEALPPPADPGALGFSPEEIWTAGRGVFGSISASLAAVIDHAFQTFGRPTGYVIGDEGGGAFFAGLRYGQGRLVTKRQGARTVYWQGPSAGFDFGVAGSQVMFLVYNVEDHEQMFQRYTGVDGSAYLVGGVGLTVLKRGKVLLAPIRTGLGLRVGASLGYLKFTSQPSLNPF